MKISPADTWFSRCVREAAGWACLRCGKQHEENSTGLHNSHIFSRRHRTIRWCKDNTQALCFSCHQWFGGNPVESGRWVEEIAGTGLISLLIEKKNSNVKVSKLEEKEIAKFYKKEWEKLRQRRAEGETGKLDFESWQ